MSAANQAGEMSDKARALAEGTSEVTNCGALAMLLAVGAAVWLGFGQWHAPRKGRS